MQAPKREKSLHYCVAMSDERLERLSMIYEPFTSLSVCEFIEKNFKLGEINGDESVVLVFDNASQHLALASKECF